MCIQCTVTASVQGTGPAAAHTASRHSPRPPRTSDCQAASAARRAAPHAAAAATLAWRHAETTAACAWGHLSPALASIALFSCAPFSCTRVVTNGGTKGRQSQYVRIARHRGTGPSTCAHHPPRPGPCYAPERALADNSACEITAT